MTPEEVLRSIMSENEIESAVQEKIKKFHGFLTREVALKLIAKEKGLLKEEEKVIKLAELSPEIRRAALVVSVERIYPIAKYRSDKRSRRVLVKDESGEKTLVLWNEDIDITTKIRTGDVIEIRGAYEKQGEIYLGYSGMITVKHRAGFSDISNIEKEEGKRVHLKGYISSIKGLVWGRFLFSLSDGKNEIECAIIRDLQRGNALRKGDEAVIESAVVEGGKIKIGEHSRIFIRRKERILSGTIREIDCKNEEMSVLVGSERLVLDRRNALRFMGVNIADDITLRTIVMLKKDALLNTNINMKVTRENGKIIVN